MLATFFNPSSFALVDLLPENESFPSAYFIGHLLHPLVQLHASAAGDNSRRKLQLQLHFDDSAGDTSHAIVEKMVRLGCRRVLQSGI
jgi:hypothetical protein